MNKNKSTNEKMADNKKGKTPMDIALYVVRRNINTGINTDPLGSWTGVPEDENDTPVQDADDL